MDPYHTLGVQRGCTRDEVKKAFRAMAWRAHPDRGGDQIAFIQLCAAYKQILKEVGRIPNSRARKRARVARNNRPPKPRDPDARSGPPRSPQPTANEHPPKPPEPTWKPDLILLDEEPRDTRPWVPADPNWDPDVVVHDDEADDDRAHVPPENSATAEPYRSWLRRVSDRSRRRESVWQSGWARTVGLIVFLAILAANGWLAWVAWTMETDEAARGSARTLWETQQKPAGRTR